MIQASLIAKRLVYNPETGIFCWSQHEDNRFPGRQTGTLSIQGYRIISLGGYQFRCARLAWVCMTGEWPSNDIDHINRDTTDDRWCNLRSTTKSQNLANSKLRDDNISGARGVSWATRQKKWHARVKHVHLGYFNDFNEAIKARDAYAKQVYGDFAALNTGEAI